MKHTQKFNIPTIDCIWRLSPVDILELQGVSLAVDSNGSIQLPIFDGKKIMDFWAGISDFLNYISKLSSPKSLITVDIMYKTPEIYGATVSQTRENIQKKARNYTSWKIKKNLREDDLTWFIKRLNSFKRLQSIINSDSHHWEQIRKVSSVEDVENEIGTFDYIYITHTFYCFSNKEEVFYWLLEFLSPEWKLIITDYYPTRDNGWETIKYLTQLQKEWFPGITLLWINKNAGDVSVEVTKECLEYFQN